MAAIYQQARPATFAEVVGQEHVKEVLVAALQKGRIGHAYLFSGPRGVGKTTSARLLAMAVNCEQENPADRPCGQCESCRSIRAGHHPDVSELDAASNNSVEDIRELRERVNLSALKGGKRVWVLDEAHMLSRAASNALLKTLEEPPPNSLFILATTEPEKLPPTILSRCQHFRFRRLSENEISGKLARLCQNAGVEADEDALSLVARAAEGAMRDAESLLERLLTSGERITRQNAEEALGLPPEERLQTLAKELVTGNLEALFRTASALYHDGFAPRSLAERLILTLREALYSAVGLSDRFSLERSEEELRRLIHALDDELARFVRHDDLFSLEVALIKALNAITHNVPADAVHEVAARTSTASTPKAAAPLPDFDPHTSAAKPAQAQTPKTPPKSPSAPPPKPAAKVSWRDVQKQASAQLKAFLNPATAEIDGETITLTFSDTYKFHFEQLKRRQGELSELTAQVLGGGFTLHIRGPGEALTKKS